MALEEFGGGARPLAWPETEETSGMVLLQTSCSASLAVLVTSLVLQKLEERIRYYDTDAGPGDAGSSLQAVGTANISPHNQNVQALSLGSAPSAQRDLHWQHEEHASGHDLGDKLAEFIARLVMSAYEAHGEHVLQHCASRPADVHRLDDAICDLRELVVGRAAGFPPASPHA